MKHFRKPVLLSFRATRAILQFQANCRFLIVGTPRNDKSYR